MEIVAFSYFEAKTRHVRGRAIGGQTRDSLLSNEQHPKCIMQLFRVHYVIYSIIREQHVEVSSTYIANVSGCLSH